MSLKKNRFYIPSFRITLRYWFIAIFLLVAVSVSLPLILNYGPESINSSFDIEMSYISYTQQFLIISLVVLLTLYLVNKFLLRDIDKWYALSDEDKYKDIKLINKIRKKCFNLPYIIFCLEIIIPLILTVVFLFMTGSHNRIMVTKVSILVTSLLFALAVCSYTFAKDIYSEVLSKTYIKSSNIGYRVSLRKKIFLQLMPLFLTGICILSLVGYSRTVAETENVYFSVYHKSLNNAFSTEKIYTYDEAAQLLNNIDLYDNTHSKFIIDSNQNLNTLSGPAVNDFVKEYTIQLSQKYDGKTYDSYGVDAQGSTLQLKTQEGIIYVGILYNITSDSSLTFFLVSIIILIGIVSFVLYLFGKSLSKDLTTISDGFNRIYLSDDEASPDLPVISNDEIGDLVIAFNKIQKQQQEYLLTIKDNQNMLMERERLASLGQLIGGIAHNLKTPIMSISGAAEGLTDLIKEYKTSVGDPEVTIQDHQDIAKDMTEWVNKIREYTEYMSDVITAVKGQAVTMSDEQAVSFSLDELVKRVDILMKHELKNSLINLNIQMKAEPNTILKGNINSLVQVINNMISNAIQAYNGETDKSINLILEDSGSNIIISVQDFGSGLPEEVQSKLFKEMITTKGKNGTGLGLFMSYSTIRAHFNGIIRFETEKGKGTIFHIVLPK